MKAVCEIGCISGKTKRVSRNYITVTKSEKKDVKARDWLRENGYEDIADTIDQIHKEWEKEGKKTRRNWWEVLAGGIDGKPRKIAGRKFPVLAVAQKRQGLPVTKNAIRRSRTEKAPKIWKPRGGALPRAKD